MTEEYREREIKYDAAAGWVLGRAEQLTVPLDSVYFDTEQHDLLAHGVTLRCRTGQTDAGWQLTVPDGDARTEIRVGPTGSHTTVPKTSPRWFPVSAADYRYGTSSPCTPTAPRTG